MLRVVVYPSIQVKNNHLTLTQMKNIIYVAALFAFALVSCNTASSDTHTHEDGSSHSGCQHEQADSKCQEQEVFEVKTDSIHDCIHDSTAVEHEHTHDEGNQHSH
jgi:hypothetical protein